MFDGKFIATLFAIAVSIFAICNFNTKKITSHEGFGFGNLPTTTWTKEKVCACSQEAASKGDFYTVPPNYQMNISPRFSNVNYGANIRYDMPRQNHQACDPLTFGNMASENFTTGSKESFHSGKRMEGNYAAEKYNKLSGQSEYLEASHMVPIGDMTTLNALGEHTHHSICYERFIHSNRKSHKKGKGCPIRGDLAISPVNTGWFSVSANPSTDLQQGALQVIGGNGNESSLLLADLINSTSGQNAIAGVNMSSSRNMLTGDYMNTVQVNAFS